MSKTMWLSRDKDSQRQYRFREDEPELDLERGLWLSRLGNIQLWNPKDFARVFPSLKLRPGQCIKVKVTNTKTGVSIRRV
jgi:hypothetical protein